MIGEVLLHRLCTRSGSVHGNVADCGKCRLLYGLAIALFEKFLEFFGHAAEFSVEIHRNFSGLYFPVEIFHGVDHHVRPQECVTQAVYQANCNNQCNDPPEAGVE